MTSAPPETERYSIEHVTTYRYDGPVSVSRHVARLQPLTDAGQRLLGFELDIDPGPSLLDAQPDYFGNTVHRFSIASPHETLTVTARSEVVVDAAEPDVEGKGAAWESVRDSLRADRSAKGLSAFECTFPSPMLPCGEAFADYARSSFTPGRPLLEAAMAFTLQIHTECEFDPAATTIATPVDEVLAKRRGVCQDFAHLQIACLRSLGLAARYVSGYIRTEPAPGKKRLVGADATHAWVAVYCPESGWVEFDPTNKRLAGTSHVRVAHGRDFADVSPLRGTVIGGGSQRLSIGVTMRPASEGATDS